VPVRDGRGLYVEDGTMNKSHTLAHWKEEEERLAVK